VEQHYSSTRFALTYDHSTRTGTIGSFAVLACLLGWSLYIASALGADLEPAAMPLGPIAAAAIVAAILGRPALREWRARLTRFRTGAAWYGIAVAAPVVLIVCAVLVNHLLGAPLPTREQLSGWTMLPAEFLGILILVGIGEEAGWTAFAAPLLLRRYSLLIAWAVLAAVRVIWHVPLMVAGELPLVLGIGGNAAFQFLLLWVFRRSGGVWFLAALWHAMLNTMGGTFFFQMVEGADRDRLGVLMTVAYVLAAVGAYLVHAKGADATPTGTSDPDG
jgi:membrane protease YdiL (CAAX protease family)